MHMWLCNVFYDHGNVPIPCSNSLIVRCCDKPLVVVHKSNCIHWSQMLIILLRYLSTVNVILIHELDKLIKDRIIGLTWIIFLSDMPARKMCCLSSSGWNLIQKGILPFPNRAMHSPVSVSQSFITLSYPQERNLRPSFENVTSLTDFV